jgi:hypothetical protein
MEVREAFDLIQNNRKEIEQYVKDIGAAQSQSGTPQSWHKMAVQRAEMNDASTLKLKREQAALENAQVTNLGDERNLSEAEILRQQRLSLENNDNFLKTWQVKKVGEGIQYVGGGSDTVRLGSETVRKAWDYNPLLGYPKVREAITDHAFTGLERLVNYGKDQPFNQEELEAKKRQFFQENPGIRRRSEQKPDQTTVSAERTVSQAVVIGNVNELATAIADKVSEKKKPQFSRNAGNPDERAQ